jgi:hypothetical protein
MEISHPCKWQQPVKLEKKPSKNLPQAFHFVPNSALSSDRVSERMSCEKHKKLYLNCKYLPYILDPLTCCGLYYLENVVEKLVDM